MLVGSATKKIVLTLNEITQFLNLNNIPLENFVLRNLYSFTLRYRRRANTVPDMSESASVTHDETRGCLFDMNGIKSDIVESCDTPIICPDCQRKLIIERLPEQEVETVKGEIKKIRKHLYYQIVDFIKEWPKTALLLSSLYAILLGIVGSISASFAYDWIKKIGE